MARVPEGSRIRTKFLGGAQNGKITIAATASYGPAVVDEWIVQDDIKIVGVEMINEIDMADAISNADFEMQCIFELSRAGTIERDSIIASCQNEMCWNGIISVGGEPRKEVVIMFPQGYGIEIDEGEVINLVAYASGVKAGDSYVFASAIIYYVER